MYTPAGIIPVYVSVCLTKYPEMLRDKTQVIGHATVIRTIGFSRPIHFHRHYNEGTQLLFMTIHSVNPLSLEVLASVIHIATSDLVIPIQVSLILRV